MPKHVPGKHMFRHMLGHVLKHVHRHVLKHVPEHMSRCVLELCPRTGTPTLNGFYGPKGEDQDFVCRLFFVFYLNYIAISKNSHGM